MQISLCSRLPTRTIIRPGDDVSRSCWMNPAPDTIGFNIHHDDVETRKLGIWSVQCFEYLRVCVYLCLCMSLSAKYSHLQLEFTSVRQLNDISPFVFNAYNPYRYNTKRGSCMSSYCIYFVTAKESVKS